MSKKCKLKRKEKYYDIKLILLDLKEIKRGANKYSFGHNVTKQAKSFIMDVTNNSNMTDELINANLENAFNYKQDLNYIIIKRDNNLLGIYKRK